MNFSMNADDDAHDHPADGELPPILAPAADNETKGEGQGRELECNIEDPLRRALSFERVSDEADPPKNGEYREEDSADLLVDSPIGDQDYHRDNRGNHRQGDDGNGNLSTQRHSVQALILSPLRRYVVLVLAQQQRSPFLRFFQRVEAIRGQPHAGAADRAYH